MNKANVSIILQVGSDGLIYVSVNPIMSLFIALWSLTISSTGFESDLIFWTKTVIVSSDIVFFT